MAYGCVVYCVWAGDSYYPTGPGDLKGVFFNKEDADALEESLRNQKKSWNQTQYYDWVTQTREFVDGEPQELEKDSDYDDTEDY